MPIRPPTCVRAARAARQALTVTPRNTFSTTTRRSGGGGAPQYDPPTGWLFGVRPGEKYEKEGWENIFFYGFCGSLGVFAVAYAFKPDTSIQTWALEEARRRLEAEGILEDPFPEKK
ncbi:ESSS subunit of NADH:ubiquinone oxidoreductase [Immersiella caudata]|uniref:NADH dehydrogenase [ubiquinone] 1 beta subcomplex subunit 11, mitochondrial n=1 Tax=Immersiella caudata TaxID=314043 RepID=A0AA39WKL1_9PEZI|nr:ESSS subunit of NADH:ubiquinone oxidoreductase [Immersiella caudata]